MKKKGIRTSQYNDDRHSTVCYCFCMYCVRGEIRNTYTEDKITPALTLFGSLVLCLEHFLSSYLADIS